MKIEGELIIDIVGDYSTNASDLAFAEVKNKFFSIFMGMNIKVSCFGVSPFNTIENAFFISQIALNSKLGKNHIIFHNVAPRKDNKLERVDNDGEKLAFSVLPNGVIIIGVYSGSSFSFINEVSEVYISKCQTSGSQFRSRDIFPEYSKVIFEKYLNGSDFSSIIERKIEIGTINKIEEGIVLYVDGFGNLKANIDHNNIKSDTIDVEINGVKMPVKFSADKGIFSVKDGDFVLSKGSSGWNINSVKKEFYEIVLRGGNAAKAFGNPTAGTKINIIE